MRVPVPIPTIPSNLVYVIHHQHNDVEQMHEKYYEFYASGWQYEMIGNGSNFLLDFERSYKSR
jgi:hypothetical protein